MQKKMADFKIATDQELLQAIHFSQPPFSRIMIFFFIASVLDLLNDKKLNVSFVSNIFLSYYFRSLAPFFENTRYEYCD